MLADDHDFSKLCTYDSNFATKLVLDLARLDCIWAMLVDELG
jgi:hypothetical protein